MIVVYILYLEFSMRKGELLHNLGKGSKKKKTLEELVCYVLQKFHSSEQPHLRLPTNKKTY